MTTDHPVTTAATGRPPEEADQPPAATAHRRRGLTWDQLTGTSPAAGRLLGQLSVLPALLAMAWLLTGLPLLMLGWFTLPLMLALSIPLTAVLLAAGLRSARDLWPVPGWWPAARPEAATGQAGAPWWAVAGVIAVAVAFGAEQLIYHSEQIIVLRDPASYIQFAAWISRHGSLPIPQSRGAFGGGGPLTFASPAFYQVGGSIVPQFMAGLPMVLAAAFWAGGVSAAVLVAPVLGAAAVLTFGGLAARLTGPRWAPLAALALALTLPEQYTSRASFSEPLAQILFLGGLGLVIDSLTAGGVRARVLAGLGGLALGLTVLVRIDGISDILPVVPYAGLLLIRRRPQAIPLIGGLGLGGLAGLADGLLLSRPYLAHNKASVLPVLALAALVTVLTAAAVPVLRRRRLPVPDWAGRRGRLVLGVAAALPFVVLLVLAVRPYVHPIPLPGPHSGHPGQTQHHYLQYSLHWVFWYLGGPALLLAAAGAAVLARRCLRGGLPAWSLALTTFGWIIITVLYRPAIVPQQPWASRRLVPGVLPGLILLAVWAAGWLVILIRRRYEHRLLATGAGAVLAAALAVPAATTTFGGWAQQQTEAGEITAVHAMCAALPRDSSVVLIDQRVSGRFTEVIRGMCGYPAAVLASPTPARVQRVVGRITAADRQPVLLATRRAALARYGIGLQPVMRLNTTQEEGTRMHPPEAVNTIDFDAWMLEPAR